MTRRVCVLKLGSSVIPDEAALAASAAEILRWRDRGYHVVAVVSAFAGVTDDLHATAGRLCDEPRPDLLAALQATGEAHSAAMLALACHQRGLRPTVLDARTLGIVTDGPPLDAWPRQLASSALARALDIHPIVVVPGFVGCGIAGETTLLGRGGSDMTALFLAHTLGADRCVLLKDVDGWYVDDPRIAGFGSPRYQTLHWDDALESPAPLVQDKAVALARSLRQPFDVASLDSLHPTAVGPTPTHLNVPIAVSNRVDTAADLDEAQP